MHHIKPTIPPKFLKLLLHHHRLASNIWTMEERTDYTRFLSEIALRRKPSLVRELAALKSKSEPGSVFMAGGYPNAELFPFTSMSIQLSTDKKVHFEGQDLISALGFQPSMGFPTLRETLKTMQKHFHNPPNWDRKDVIVTLGSQHGLSSVIEMVVNMGDPVLVPVPCYSSLLTILDPHLPKYLPVPGDHLGIVPGHLRNTLDVWAKSNILRRKPRLLYVNPTGANPSGSNLPTDRKKEIYKIAQEFDLLILEDDPYYFLHFQDKDPTSFLSMDVDNRVIRFDSFSKIISSGLRIGFATGPSELIRQLELSVQSSVLQCASLPQVIVQSVLKEWGLPGFLKHTKTVRKFYLEKRNLMLESAEKHLKDLAEWKSPEGGMFLWLKVVGVKDTYQMAMKFGVKKGIVVLPGREFFSDRGANCPYLRCAFSTVTKEEMDVGFDRLAFVIQDERKRQKR